MYSRYPKGIEQVVINAPKVCEKSYQERLQENEYAQAALSVMIKGQMLQQPSLTECAWHLSLLDEERYKAKGKYMTLDHLKQEAVKWARAKE